MGVYACQEEVLAGTHYHYSASLGQSFGADSGLGPRALYLHVILMPDKNTFDYARFY